MYYEEQTGSHISCLPLKKIKKRNVFFFQLSQMSKFSSKFFFFFFFILYVYVLYSGKNLQFTRMLHRDAVKVLNIGTLFLFFSFLSKKKDSLVLPCRIAS